MLVRSPWQLLIARVSYFSCNYRRLNCVQLVAYLAIAGMAEKPPLHGGTGNGKSTYGGLGSGGPTFGGAGSNTAQETTTATEVLQKPSSNRDLLHSGEVKGTSDEKTKRDLSVCTSNEKSQGHLHEQQTSKDRSTSSHSTKRKDASADHPPTPTGLDSDSQKENSAKGADLHKHHITKPHGNTNVSSQEPTLPQQCSDIGLPTKTFSAAVKDNTFNDNKRKPESGDLKQGTNEEMRHLAAGQTSRAEMTGNRPLDQVEVSISTSVAIVVKYLPRT